MIWDRRATPSTALCELRSGPLTSLLCIAFDNPGEYDPLPSLLLLFADISTLRAMKYFLLLATKAIDSECGD